MVKNNKRDNFAIAKPTDKLWDKNLEPWVTRRIQKAWRTCHVVKQHFTHFLLGFEDLSDSNSRPRMLCSLTMVNVPVKKK